jgi:hypothetical protein
MDGIDDPPEGDPWRPKGALVLGLGVSGAVDSTAKGMSDDAADISRELKEEISDIKKSVSQVAPTIESYLDDHYLYKMEERMRGVSRTWRGR